MALIDTSWGSLALGCGGVLLIRVGRLGIRKGAEFYGELFQRDPVRTTMLDLLLAALERPGANPVVGPIFLWLFGWFCALLGFTSAMVGGLGH